MKYISETDWAMLDAKTDEDIAADIASDPDAAPLLTEEQFRKLRPAAETHPQLVEAYRRSRGIQNEQRQPQTNGIQVETIPSEDRSQA